MSARTQDFGILLALAYQEFVRELREEHIRHGFTDLGRSDGYVFRALAAAPLTVSALAGRLEVSKQAAGQIIDDMRRRGYVERRPDPSDARAQLLSLSERGQAALAVARRFHRTYEQRLARRHGADVVATVRRLLEEVVAGEQTSVDPHLRALYL